MRMRDTIRERNAYGEINMRLTDIVKLDEDARIQRDPKNGIQGGSVVFVKGKGYVERVKKIGDGAAGKNDKKPEPEKYDNETYLTFTDVLQDAHFEDGVRNGEKINVKYHVIRTLYKAGYAAKDIQVFWATRQVETTGKGTRRFDVKKTSKAVTIDDLDCHFWEQKIY